jgi:lipopolysaccharide transport system permease protein
MSAGVYVKNIWLSRYFWTHLTLADLRAKYRRSYLGMAWAFIQPLALTLLLSLVMGQIFQISITDYAPYVFSGLILWDFVTVSAIGGCHAFIAAEGYIKQFSHPLSIYSLRTSLSALINLMIAFIGLVVWVLLWKPANFGYAWFNLLLAFPLLLLLAWPLAIITAFIGTRFRDFSQMIVLILQAIWYISPVFFLPSVFRAAKISFLVDYNPIFHLLNLFRLPLLQGIAPSMQDYIFTLSTILVLWAVAFLFILRQEKKVIFYL